MIERESMGDAPASIMSHQPERGETKTLHQFDLIQRHGSFRIRRMIGLVGGFAAIAISAQIGSDDGIGLREVRRNEPPGYMRQRCPMEKQKRRTLSTDNAVD